jgi:tartrate dehydratase beta subunit/fumarate hydratase class I family protein
VSASVDILDVSDGLYYNMIASRLAKAPIELPYDNYQTVTGSYGPATTSLRMNSTTDCLTDIIATVKSSGYNSNSHNTVTGLSDYFTRGLKNSGTISTSVFQVNGVMYPTIPANNAAGHIFTQTGDVLGVSQDTVGASESNVFSSLATWSSNAFVHANSFTYNDGDEHRLVGISGRGNQLQASWNLTGTGDVLPICWLKSKSVLRVGANKMVEVVL